MESFNLDELVKKISARVAELEPEGAALIRVDARDDEATWSRGRFRATLIFHREEKLPRLELMLHTGGQIHPETLEIGLFDADAADMIAEPIAGLFSEHAQ